MKKYAAVLVLSSLTLACAVPRGTVITPPPPPPIEFFSSTITESGLQSDLTILSDDSMEGRGVGTDGIEKAADFLAERYQLLGFEPGGDNGTYFQAFEIPQGATKNVVAYLEGTDPELSKQVIVLSAHYDHLGIGTPDSTGDAIYNGADDDGSGTVALLHIAQALSSAKSSGVEMKRSVLFLHTSGEERGLKGSEFYADNPTFPIEQTIANLNADMIGRWDEENADNPEFIYIIGGSLISSDLQAILEEANVQTANFSLNNRYNDLNDPQQLYRRSDHWHFGKNGIPFIFFFTGLHSDYHRPSDEVDLIDFDLLKARTQLIYMTTALLMEVDERPAVDNEAFIERTKPQAQ